MKVTTHASAVEFLQTTEDWLEREESVNQLLLGLASTLADADTPRDPPAVMMTVTGPAGLEAASLMTPPRGLVLYAPGVDTDRHEQAMDALQALAEALLASGHAVPDCMAPSAAALAFAQLWSKRTGHNFALRLALRVYELRKVTFPVGVSGACRVPGCEDIDLLADWIHRFAQELDEPGDMQSARTSATQLAQARQALIWEDQGRPVSMAVAKRRLPHGGSIGGVYTPKEHRGHGYASACVAALSQRQLDAGKQFCCLFADLANPTSNGIYQKIGYVPVADSVQYKFEVVHCD